MYPSSKLRRINLSHQGLLRRAPFGRGLAGARRAIEHLGYVQIDTISVVCRAHDHVLHSRVPDYRPDMLERLRAEGSVFEYWAHAAAYLPMRDYRYALPHMASMRARRERWVRSHDDALMRRVLDRIRLDGPLRARDFQTPAGADRGQGWWDWKPAKRALEQLFMQGDLMIAGRSGFQKIYDLAERVLPPWVDTTPPTLAEYASYLVDQQLNAQGMVGLRGCVYQRTTPGLRVAVSGELEDRRRRGELILAQQPGNGRSETLFATPEVVQGRAPAASSVARLLSPFDNVIIRRQHGQALFGFDYQLECYLPAHRRRFGYFCLPLLYRDRFIGRADCKAHRREGRLEIKRLFVEHPQWLAHDTDRAPAAVADALRRFATFNDCQRVDLVEVAPPQWRSVFAAACRPEATDPNDRTGSET